jgi:hypothetical protein
MTDNVLEFKKSNVVPIKKKNYNHAIVKQVWNNATEKEADDVVVFTKFATDVEALLREYLKNHADSPELVCGLMSILMREIAMVLSIAKPEFKEKMVEFAIREFNKHMLSFNNIKE